MAKSKRPSKSALAAFNQAVARQLQARAGTGKTTTVRDLRDLSGFIPRSIPSDGNPVVKLREGWDILTNLSQKPGKRTLAAAQKFMDNTYKWLDKHEGASTAELFRTAPILSTRPSNLDGDEAQVWQLLYSRLQFLRSMV